MDPDVNVNVPRPTVHPKPGVPPMSIPRFPGQLRPLPDYDDLDTIMPESDPFPVSCIKIP